VHKIASGQGPGLIKEIGEFVAALKAPLRK
jgi:hypothetical protein